MLPWLWRRPAAVALIRPLAWEPPYATGMDLKGQKAKKKKKEKKKEKRRLLKHDTSPPKESKHCMQIDEILKPFPLTSEIRPSSFTLSLLLSFVLVVLAIEIRQNK